MGGGEGSGIEVVKEPSKQWEEHVQEGMWHFQGPEVAPGVQGEKRNDKRRNGNDFCSQQELEFA